MFVNTGEELIEVCKNQGKRIWQYTVDIESKETGLSKEEIFKKMDRVLCTMRQAVEKGMKEGVESVSGIIGNDSPTLYKYSKGKETICGEFIVEAMAKALGTSEVNAAMGRIVASPTAGSCGVLPAVILSVGEKFNFTDEQLIQGLFTASGVGILIAKNATLSGAEGGCQAEVGSASAMAAAAVVELMGGDVETALSASATVIKNFLGLVCDPVAGLVEVPCAKRNVAGTVIALSMADMALSGIVSKIPFDDTVKAMYEVGKMLPCSLRETALGGVAVTKTGIELKEKVFGE
ncbi:L-serine ammonia-lyase, iron-sulfur-dependent, subunit alpha [Clostridium bornimense]|uniref:L-serine ammonia-lyase, iron-sulfur-dependent, subunit alpha n=1 Tax=Clostridium bornimense TaxID=1216932 RepID=UPI001C0FFB38|nr:L-serine ammonia-lyase, iron-sulfur-dependent, subunit alpha [Clostridium bornimense]MBU5316004.1 L-serine ammonia-lyase, iron-sulfur-dependent, subunit alpha [Clostridium bornimense]